MLKETALAFIDDEALTRGAAIAFYTVTSIAPVLLIVIAIAGLAFGHDAAQNAITAQLSDLMGQQTAEILQTAVASASSKPSGIMATIIGVVTLWWRWLMRWPSCPSTSLRSGSPSAGSASACFTS